MKKWGIFGSGATPTPNVGVPGVTGAQEPDPLPVVTAADAKMFGLENVSTVSMVYDRGSKSDIWLSLVTLGTLSLPLSTAAAPSQACSADIALPLQVALSQA